MHRNICKLVFTSLIVFLFNTISVFSQDYNFKKYDTDDGVSKYVYTINQSDRGFLWIGTGDGLFKFNGINFEIYQTTDSIAEDFVTESFKDRDGNLWFGHKNGGITLFDGEVFKIIRENKFLSQVSGISQDKLGNVWISTQNHGLIRVGQDLKIDKFSMAFENITIHSIHVATNNELFIGTDEKVLIYNIDSNDDGPVFISDISKMPLTTINCINKSVRKKYIWIGTRDDGLFLYNTIEGILTQINKSYDLFTENIQDVVEDKWNNLWIATFGHGVFKLIASSPGEYYDLVNFNENNGLPENYIKDVFLDVEGNVWVGTFGNGLSNLNDDLFTHYYREGLSHDNDVFAIAFDKERQWFGVKKGLLEAKISSRGEWSYELIHQDIIKNKVVAIQKDNIGQLWVGTESEGVYVINLNKNSVQKVHLSDDILGNSINCIRYGNNLVWIATVNGVFSINPVTNEKYHYSTSNGIPHNNVNNIYIDRKGNVFLSTVSDVLCKISDVAIERFRIPNQSEILNITGVTEDKLGNLWIATKGKGLFKMSPEKEFTNYTVNDGLMSDYCYSIICDNANKIWVGHRQGISRYNVVKQIFRTFGKDDGIIGDCNINAITKYHKGDIWFGTTHGIVRYNHLNDQDISHAPILHLTSVKIFDEEISLEKRIVLPFDAYKIRFEFIGLNLKSPGSVRYKYKLDGYDLEWSDLSTNNSALYNRLEEGKYKFLVKAISGEDVYTLPTNMIEIKVRAPIWKQVWFIVLMVLLLIAVVYFIIKIREANHLKMKKLLQLRLNERTAKVMAQKEELQRKNNDILDSINYAKKIQQAILPTGKKLAKEFSDSFILYKPRDIVSGDFYWYRPLGDRFVIASADCTGHGVPGAFMSMIGIALLKEIVDDIEDESPKDMLYALDRGVKEHLRREQETSSGDGMDISICIYYPKEKLLRFSGAKSKILVNRKGKIERYSGDRFSIGGKYDLDKKFTDTDIMLEDGDKVYMLSDGIVDQFGGEKDKKLKLKGFEKILKESDDLPFSEQKDYIKYCLKNWKEDYDQTDDILVLGMKV